MRKILIFLTLFALAACQENGGPDPIDAQKFLSTLAGPNVPSMQDSLMDSAKNAEKKGDFSQAAMLYQQVLSKHPEDKEAALALADCTRRLGNYDQAVAQYDDLLKKDPDNLAAKEGKGLALMAKGNFDAPPVLFEEIMKTDPHRWKTLNALGILFTTRTLYSDAQQYFQAALKESPSNPSILNNLGLSEALNHEFDPAISTLHEAADLTLTGSPERKRIDLNLALVYAVDGKPEESRQIAQIYYSGAALDNNMGLYAHLAKDDQLAKDYLNMALTASKTFYEKAWNNLQSIQGGSTSGTPSSDVTITSPSSEPPAEVTDSFNGIPGAQPATPTPKMKAKSKHKAKPKPQPAPDVQYE